VAGRSTEPGTTLTPFGVSSVRTPNARKRPASHLDVAQRHRVRVELDAKAIAQGCADQHQRRHELARHACGDANHSAARGFVAMHSHRGAAVRVRDVDAEASPRFDERADRRPPHPLVAGDRPLAGRDRRDGHEVAERRRRVPAEQLAMARRIGAPSADSHAVDGVAEQRHNEAELREAVRHVAHVIRRRRAADRHGAPVERRGDQRAVRFAAAARHREQRVARPEQRQHFANRAHGRSVYPDTE
jgi:hypothetical protein